MPQIYDGNQGFGAARVIDWRVAIGMAAVSLVLDRLDGWPSLCGHPRR
ncbi:hypothetical protein ACQP2Y_25400 [Actinoplanes sp. CA-051413]